MCAFTEVSVCDRGHIRYMTHRGHEDMETSIIATTTAALIATEDLKLAFDGHATFTLVKKRSVAPKRSVSTIYLSNGNTDIAKAIIRAEDSVEIVDGVMKVSVRGDQGQAQDVAKRIIRGNVLSGYQCSLIEIRTSRI